MEVPADCSSI